MQYILIFLFYFVFSSLIAQENNIEVKLINNLYSDASVTYEKLTDFKLRVMARNLFDEPIANLKKEDFEIYKNGWKSEVTEFIPISQSKGRKIRVVICIDNSASMSRDAQDVQLILKDLINSFSKSTEIDLLFFTETKLYNLSKDLDNIAYLHFNEVNEKILEKCDLAYNQTIMTSKTYLYDQMFTAFNIVNATNIDDDDVFYIILSDGKDIGSNYNMDDVINNYQKGTIYSIDFKYRSINNNLLTELSSISNGKYYLSNNIDDLRQRFEQIGERIIFSGYEMTFTSYVPPKLFITDIYQFRNNQRFDIDRVNIEEVNSRELFPLLNYIFFDKDSSSMNEKYNILDVISSKNFNVSDLPTDQMIIYKNILNIIGLRLQKYKESNLLLTGCNDNTDNEKNNLDLSHGRALSVKNYLTETWGIDKNRISINARNLPRKPSNIKQEYGKEENRRVEIESTDPRILDVVEVYSLTNISDPEAIQLDCNVISDYKIDNWKFDVYQDNQLIYTKSEKSELPDRISWNLGSNLKNTKISKGDFNIILTVENANNIISQPINKVINVNFRSTKEKKILQQNDKFIEKLSLVLFEFNSSKLDQRNSSVLKYVKESLTDKSKVFINGYTDNSGDETFNQALSSRRANETRGSFIKILNPKTDNILSYGLGETAPLYDNQFPEGRFYNRTCQITIENPIIEQVFD